MNKQVQEILNKITLEDKARLCSGRDFWTLESVLDLPNIMVTDGPHGLRKQDGDTDHAGLNASVPATCYPTAVGLASTWDNDLIYQVGEHLGDECRTEKVSVLLGPGANIKRHPLCGRNFEYFSEDPYLSGTIASHFINGVQSKGIGTSIKHYVANNQESMRMAVDTFVDERTLREIYLKGFEIAVKDSQPWTVMCSYNKVNGTYLSEHKKFLNDILKEEWKHEGLVVTDWGACNNRVDGLIAGQELEMPGGTDTNQKLILEALKNGSLTEEMLNKRVARVIELILKSQKTLNEETTPYNKEEHHNFARKVAAETMVLLKNENNILPLNKKQKVALIGEFAVKPRYQGSGSSLINPNKITKAFDAFKEVLGNNFSYAQGYTCDKDIIDESLIKEAVETAQNADVVVLMVGLTDIFESEGFDRTHLNIPNNHLKLIEEVTKVNKNVVISLSNGSPVTMPWKNEVQGIIEQYLGGQASGEALADVVFGNVNPSGKLAETFPNNLNEFPSDSNFPGRPRQVEYQEGLYVGYRYYDSVDKQPLYPFGYGLSYTTFKYDNLIVEVKGKDINVTFDVTNTGKVEGKEISQIYFTKKDSIVYRPEKELKGYIKTSLKPNETKTVSVSIPKASLSVYNVDEFKLEDGKYNVLVGSSSKDIHLNKTISLKGLKLEKENDEFYQNISSEFTPNRAEFEKLLKFSIPAYPNIRPFTMNSVISELQHSFVGKQLKKVMLSQMSKMFDSEETDNALALMAEAMVDEMPFRALVMMSQGKISHNRAHGLLDMMNKKPLRGLFKTIKG